MRPNDLPPEQVAAARLVIVFRVGATPAAALEMEDMLVEFFSENFENFKEDQFRAICEPTEEDKF